MASTGFSGGRLEARKTLGWRGWIVLFALTALATPAGADAPRAGGTLTFGTESDFAGFEVLASGSRLALNGSIAANTIMEPLFRMDAAGNLQPVLALEAEPSDGGRLWTITLRQGVSFHDGTPFNADAVVRHWERLLDPQNRFSGRAAVSPVVTVEKVDDSHVIFRLKHPWLPFLSAMGSPRSLADLIPSPKAVAEGTQNRAPVGTGPFVFKEWVSGDRFVVVKNSAYWDREKPFLERIVFKAMPDPQTRFASLLAGQADMIWMDRGNIIERARQEDHLRVFQGDDNGAEIFILNLESPPMDDAGVRQALAHASSQERFVKLAYQDSLPVVRHPFGEAFQCPDDGYREYDPDKARALIAAYGKPVGIELMHSSSKRGKDIGEIAQQLFKDAGVETRPVGLAFGPVIKKVLSGDYQISTWRMSSRPDQGPALFQAFHSSSRGNYSHYKNPEMDRLLEAQRLESDPVKRDALLCDIARLINRDVPVIYRGGMRNHVIAAETVKAVPEMTYGILQFGDIWLDR